MESLDRANERAARRLDERIYDPPIVRSLSDIQQIVAQFDPVKNQSTTTEVAGTIVDPQTNATYRVTAPTTHRSRRDIILDGMKLIERMDEAAEAVAASEGIAVNGLVMKPPKIRTSESRGSNLDKLIRQWFGGIRDGCNIFWDLPDGYKYLYDIKTHKLSRRRNGS